MVSLLVLVGVSLAYAEMLLENFTDGTSKVIVDCIFAVGITALICLPILACLRLFYHRKMDTQRHECRQLIAKLLESRVDKPDSTPLRDLEAMIWTEAKPKTPA